MGVYKKSVDFIPRPVSEDIAKQHKVSRVVVYAIMLPVAISVLWIISLFVEVYFKYQVKYVEDVIARKNTEIATYDDVRKKQTELVLKIDALEDVVERDFDPEKFFKSVNEIFGKTNDTFARVYSYARSKKEYFVIRGRASSYLDLAKIIVVFNLQEEFQDVSLEAIYYDKEQGFVNFEISFDYKKHN